MKPMFDDILTYFEEVGQKIKNYKWDKLATNFNNIWFKIKKAISEKSFWKMFELGAELAIKYLNYAGFPGNKNRGVRYAFDFIRSTGCR